MKQKHGMHQANWMSIVQICWELWWLDIGMQATRRELFNRKGGRPKINKQFKKLGIPSHPKAELSNAYVFEFYLQCMKYHFGPKAVLAWCKAHLKTKELSESWQHPLHFGIDEQYLRPILNECIFESKKEEDRRKLLWVSGRQVFENPFAYIIKNVWMWNSPIDYCLNKFDELDILGEKAVAFRAFLHRELKNTHTRIDNESFDRYVRKAKNYIRVIPKPD